MTLTCEEACDRILENRGDLPRWRRGARSHLESCAACSSTRAAPRASRRRCARVSRSGAARARGPDRRELPRGLPPGPRGFAAALARPAVDPAGARRTLRSGRRPISGPADGPDGRRDARLRRCSTGSSTRTCAGLGRCRPALREPIDRLRAPRVLRGRIESSARYSSASTARGATGSSRPLLSSCSSAAGCGSASGRRRRPSSAADLQSGTNRSLDALDPMARSLLGGLSGGLVDAPGGSGEPAGLRLEPDRGLERDGPRRRARFLAASSLLLLPSSGAAARGTRARTSARAAASSAASSPPFLQKIPDAPSNVAYSGSGTCA